MYEAKSGVSLSVSVLCILTVQDGQFRFSMTLMLLMLKLTAADWTSLVAFVKFAGLEGEGDTVGWKVREM